MSGITFVPFLESQMGGAIAVNVFAIVCTLALASVALRVVWLAVRRFLVRNASQPQEHVFFHTQLGNYAACLLIAMIFNTLAGMMMLPWLIQKGITQGSLCIAQGFIMQVGTWSSGYFTVTIAVHTFNSLVLKCRQSTIISRTTITIGWALSFLMAAVPFIVSQPDGDIYGADGFMCAIRDTYPKLQFFLHLLPILLASILSVIFYSIIFLTLRGTLKIKGGIKLTLGPNERWTNMEGENYQRFVARVARSMIWYPIAYVALLVPYSVMRLLYISGFNVPYQGMVFACACWFTLGVVNVVLLYNTFRILGPAFDACSLSSTRKDMESFGTSGFLEKAGSRPFSSSQRSAMQEKIDQYHSAFGYRTTTPESFSQRSTHSTQHLLPVHSRDASRQSFYNYRISPVTVPASLPMSGLDSPISSPEPAMEKSSVAGHFRQDSTSSQSLPAPPRRPSPVNFQSLSDTSVEGRQPLLHQSSKDSLGSTIFGVRKIDSWSYSHENSEPHSASQQSYHGMKPSLSAFAPSFTLPTSRSPPRQLTLLAGRTSVTSGDYSSRPATAPLNNGSQRAGQKPLLLSRGLSVDASDLTYTNPRMPPSPPRAYGS